MSNPKHDANTHLASYAMEAEDQLVAWVFTKGDAEAILGREIDDWEAIAGNVNDYGNESAWELFYACLADALEVAPNV